MKLLLKEAEKGRLLEELGSASVGKPKRKSYGGAGADIFSEENPFSGVNFG